MTSKKASAKNWWHGMTGARCDTVDKYVLCALARALTLCSGPYLPGHEIALVWEQHQYKLERYSA